MSESAWGDKETQFFYSISADDILKAVDSAGFMSTGRVLQLNSYENRVYEIEIELEETSRNPSDHFKIIKFYRPGRWSKQQIQDEHDFLWELKEQDVPVVAPLKFENKTIFEYNSIMFALFPKQGGRNPYEMEEELCTQLGRILGKVHLIGKQKKATSRIQLTPQNYGRKNLDFLLSAKLILPAFEPAYVQTVERLLDLINPLFEGVPLQRIHGDCHRGNILIGSSGPNLVDFDDMVMGPIVQDFWLLFPGRDAGTLASKDFFLDGYETFNEFDYSQLKLIEPLRALRFIHFSAWIGKRWQDPAFKNAFDFGTPEYWNGEIRSLQEQIEIIEST